MKAVLINLRRATERRERMEREFRRAGLRYRVEEAVDGRHLTAEHLALVDRENRPFNCYWQDDGEIGCWLSHRNVLLDLAENGPDMLAVFEDDARFTPELVPVLDALERKPFDFDVVSLFRHSNRARPFIFRYQVTPGVRVGIVKRSVWGLAGYVVTRPAAQHFLAATPRMVRPIDYAILNYWESGLNVLHVSPSVVRHDFQVPSQIEEGRSDVLSNARKSRTIITLLKRIPPSARYSLRRELAFRRLKRGKFGVTHWG